MNPIAPLLFAATWLLGGAALAQSEAHSPVGDWTGTMGSGRTHVAVHIEQASSGVLRGDIDLPDSGIWDAPLEVTLQNGALAYSYRGGTRRFAGRWDPAAEAWVGKFQTPTGSTDLSLKAGFLGMPVVAGLDGRWEGVFNPGAPAKVILRIATNGHGSYALMDLPHAMETNIPVTALARQGDAVSFAVPAIGMRFEGVVDPATPLLKGRFGGPGSDFALTFARTDRGAPRRTQMPTGPLPYTNEELVLTNPGAPGVQLGCTLTLPKAKGLHPVALLLTGTGQQDRDEAIVFHRPFLVLADHLARHGVASLRCDDRGVGASTGDFRAASLEDLAADVVAELSYLRARADILPGKIGLIGHSEGGLLASMVAAERKDLAFVVLMAGPGVPIHDLLLKQGEETARAQGAPEAAIAQQAALQAEIFGAARAAATPEAALAAVEALLVSKGLPAEAARAQAAQVVRPDILRILKADPGVALARISAPVLAVVGSKDTQVPPAQNLPALRAALARNPDATVMELAGLNHMMQTAKTGAVAEYYEIEETMAPSAMSAVSTWLSRRGIGVDSPGKTR